MTAEQLIAGLQAKPMERLRWLVLKEFGVLPGSRRARCLGDGDLLECGAHMVLDSRGRSAALPIEAEDNASFQEDRFVELSGGTD